MKDKSHAKIKSATAIWYRPPFNASPNDVKQVQRVRVSYESFRACSENLKWGKEEKKQKNMREAQVPKFSVRLLGCDGISRKEGTLFLFW